MLRLTLTFCALLTAALLLTAPASAGVYKWKDADGKVHFSDKPPPDVEAESIRTPSTRVDSHTADRLNQFKQQANEGVEKRNEAKAAAAEKKQEAEQMAAHCAEVRQQLQNLEWSTRRQFINDKGEREFLPDEKRQEWMQKARDELAENC